MDNKVFKVEGNLYLGGIENHPSYIVLPMIKNCLATNGITLSCYHCKEIPEGITRMKFSDFIERYKECEVEVEGEVIFELKRA